MNSNKAQSTDIIDLAVTEAELDSGIPPSIVISRSNLDPFDLEVLTRDIQGWKEPVQSPRIRTWTEEEDRIVDNGLGKLSLAEIGEILGRSENGVKIRFTRKGWTAPSKQIDEMNAGQIGQLLCKCGKSIALLIDRGILPGRKLPMDRNIRVVNKKVLKRWLVNPQNWIYFNWERIQDPRIRRLCELKAGRWSDEWLSAGDAGAILGSDHRSVNRWIHLGKFKRARKWGSNWKFLRSEIEDLKQQLCYEGSPTREKFHWTEEADGFLVLSRAVGITINVIEKLMGPKWKKKASYRINCLHRQGKIPSLIENQKLGVKYRVHPEKDAPDIFGDWRRYSNRYPFLISSVNRFASGATLGIADISNLRGNDDPSLKPAIATLAAGGRKEAAHTRLIKGYSLLKSKDLDPFSLE